MRKFWPGVFVFVLVLNVSYAQNTRLLKDQERLFNRARDLFQKEKYNPARTAFADYAASYDDQRRVSARYYEALCGLYLFHPDAVDRLKVFQDEHPESPLSQRIDYELGTYFYQQEDFDEAAIYLRKVDFDALSAEERVEVQFKLAYSYFTQQNFDDAEPLFHRVKGMNSSYSNPSYYYHGIIAYKQGKYEEAERDLKMLSNDDSYKRLIPELLANIYYKKGELVKLKKIAEEVLNSRGVRNKRNIYMMLADVYFQEGNYKKADEYFGYFLEGRRSLPDAETSYRVAYTAFQVDDFDRAIEYFDQAAFRGNDSLKQISSFYLGRIHLKNEQIAYAENAFEVAAGIEINPGIKEEASFALAKLQFDSRLRAKSIDAFKNYIEQYPEGKYIEDANRYLSEAYLTSNNFEAAIRHIESIKNKSGLIRETYQKVTFYRGVEQFNDREFKSAIDNFDKSLSVSIDPDFVIPGYYWKGEAYSILQQYDEAINAYAGVFRNEKDEKSDFFLKTRYGIAYAYFNSKQYSKALAHFREYTAKLENKEDKMYYGDALVRLADCYLVLKKNQEAYATYKKASMVYPDYREYIYYRLGVVSWFLGKKDEALRYLNSVIDDYDDSRYYDDALYEYANIYFENSEFQDAIRGFTKLINEEERSPFLPYAYLNRGISYMNVDKPGEAIKDYRKILNAYTSHNTAVDAITGLQEALQLSGREDEYEEDKRKFAAANPESDALVSLDFEGARNQYFAGNYEKAVSRFKSYLNEYGKNRYYPEANYYLAESYYLMNKEDSALKYHLEVLKSPGTAFINKSILRTGDILYEKGNYREAIPKYNLLKHLSRTRNEEIFAWQGLMLSNYNLNQYDSAMAFAQLIAERGEAAFGAQNKALLYLGKSARELGQYDKAEDYFNACREAGDDENAAEAFYNIAEMRSDLGDYQKSIDLSLDLIAKYSHYPDWNDAAFLLIAKNFYLMEEYFQARSTLESIIANSPNENTVSKAKELLDKVKDKEEEMIKEEELEKDSLE